VAFFFDLPLVKRAKGVLRIDSFPGGKESWKRMVIGATALHSTFWRLIYRHGTACKAQIFHVLSQARLTAPPLAAAWAMEAPKPRCGSTRVGGKCGLTGYFAAEEAVETAGRGFSAATHRAEARR
jgi:hypothetical protein